MERRRGRDTENSPKWSEEDWRVKQDFDCVMKAKEIEKDPARMERVKELAKQKVEERTKEKPPEEATS